MTPISGRFQPRCVGAPRAAARRLVLVLALVGTAGEVWASRQHRPMGDYVREAAVIVIAEEHQRDQIMPSGLGPWRKR